jgi:regulator of sigma E protease
MSWVWVILGITFLVFIHELGHFLVARAMGAKATRFLVGFPPVFLKFRRGETEYGLGAIPLGGYVRIVGMMRPQPGDAAVCHDALEELATRRPDGHRDILGPAVQVLDEALPGAGDSARVAAERALLALDAEQDLLHAKTYRETKKGLERLRDDLDRRAYWRLPVGRRIAIIAAGPVANVLAAIAILAIFFSVGVPQYEITTRVDAVSATPALTAGLQPGDEIVEIDGQPLAGDWQRAVDLIQESDGAPIALTVQRDGREVPLEAVRPIPQGDRWILGFTFTREDAGVQRDSPPEAVVRALEGVWLVTSGTVVGIKDAVTSSEGREQVSSIVGIAQVSEESVQAGQFPAMLAFISMALAIFNLLPFLPLDGGHIVIALMEKLRRGRPLSRVAMERFSIVGIALILVLFVIGLNNDIGRISAP